MGKVLTGNGITRCERGSYALVGGDELSDAERDQLLDLCRQRLDAFREQRGEEVFAHRSRHRTPISGSIKYRVLTRARGRCECCGAHEHQRALEVDHIVPRNHGGTGDLSNLQALCFRCNAGKRQPARGGLCVLRAGGQRPGAAGERAGVVNRRCRPGDTGPQPGEPQAPFGRRAGAAPAGMERRGGAAEAAAGGGRRRGVRPKQPAPFYIRGATVRSISNCESGRGTKSEPTQGCIRR